MAAVEDDLERCQTEPALGGRDVRSRILPLRPIRSRSIAREA